MSRIASQTASGLTSMMTCLRTVVIRPQAATDEPRVRRAGARFAPAVRCPPARCRQDARSARAWTGLKAGGGNLGEFLVRRVRRAMNFDECRRAGSLTLYLGGHSDHAAIVKRSCDLQTTRAKRQRFK